MSADLNTSRRPAEGSSDSTANIQPLDQTKRKSTQTTLILIVNVQMLKLWKGTTFKTTFTQAGEWARESIIEAPTEPANGAAPLAPGSNRLGSSRRFSNSILLVSVRWRNLKSPLRWVCLFYACLFVCFFSRVTVDAIGGRMRLEPRLQVRRVSGCQNTNLSGNLQSRLRVGKKTRSYESQLWCWSSYCYSWFCMILHHFILPHASCVSIQSYLKSPRRWAQRWRDGYSVWLRVHTKYHLLAKKNLTANAGRKIPPVDQGGNGVKGIFGIMFFGLHSRVWCWKCEPVAREHWLGLFV